MGAAPGTTCARAWSGWGRGRARGRPRWTATSCATWWRGSGKAYDTRLHRRRDGLGQMRIYLEVMWKHLHQRSFHMSEAQYMEQLDAVVELCSIWGCAEEVREGIRDCKKRPILDTVGAKAVQIPL